MNVHSATTDAGVSGFDIHLPSEHNSGTKQVIKVRFSAGGGMIAALIAVDLCHPPDLAGSTTEN